MDPNLFHLDWNRTGEVLATIVLLSMLVERALSLIFENRRYLEWEKARDAATIAKGGKKGDPLKEILAFAVSLAVCIAWNFDAVSILLVADEMYPLGYAVTAAIIAGGSKGSIKLFREWLGFMSSARKEIEDAKKAAAAAKAPPTPTMPAATP